MKKNLITIRNFFQLLQFTTHQSSPRPFTQPQHHMPTPTRFVFNSFKWKKKTTLYKLNIAIKVTNVFMEITILKPIQFNVL